ncbi:metallophosphoesterase [Ruminococcus sp. 5_1_39BFAA]|uniref:metallophosphoesterase n=1 Tax=Ruminococcus sp. 5_1_39BFAA TaxID=457412 RepID=UPI00356A13CC
MKKFQTRTYEILSTKIKDKRGVRFALLADLHGLEFGPENADLLAQIEKSRPDAILAAGDMIVRIQKESLSVAENLLLKLAKKYPVFYSMGNHEFKMDLTGEFHEDFLEYEKRLQNGGVVILHNESAVQTLGKTEFVIHGLELPMEYFHKPNSPNLSMETLERIIGKPDQKRVNILMAHSPKYGDTYLSWGADLTVSGHYHGGILRFSEHCGLTCPQYLLFPPYCCGDFHRGDSHMIVSAGLGEHTIPVRIHNPRELLLIDMKPEKEY